MESPKGRKPITKFEEMSGFKEIESARKEEKWYSGYLNSFLINFKFCLDFLDEYVVSALIGLSIVVVLFDLVFYGADMMYNFFQMILLCVLLYYRYKRGKL